ncbi:MAG: pyridoxamine 5'-phosphate oxidase family protein [Gammaproteobacteria bacterium]|nr:pyridoxamine 5'-phosphate oxidase family protein [Gammaproteobacteria bacterium]
MNDDTPEGAGDITAEAARFRAGFRSVMLATVDADGTPEASYAPYVTGANGCFYIFVSGLARHTRNLARSGKAAALFLQEEGAAANPFVRVRLSYSCAAVAVAPDTREWAEAMEHFEREFGNIVPVLRSLPDFRLFRLAPDPGRYVRGFGRAYDLKDGSPVLVGPGRPTPGGPG